LKSGFAKNDINSIVYNVKTRYNNATQCTTRSQWHASRKKDPPRHMRTTEYKPMHGQIENIVPSVACKMGGGCTEIQKTSINYNYSTIPQRQILPVRSSVRSSKTAKGSDLTSLPDLITHLCCCSEDLYTKITFNCLWHNR